MLRVFLQAGHAIHFANPSDRPIGYWSGRQSEGGQRFYLENSELLLDSPGEWFLRPNPGNSDGGGTLMYIPLKGEDMAVVDAKLPVATDLLVLAGAVDVELRSVTIAHSDWQCGGITKTEPCDQQSAQFQAGAAVRVMPSVDVPNPNRIVLAGVKLLRHGQNALWIDGGCSRVTFDGGTVADLGTGGIRVGHAHAIGAHGPPLPAAAVSDVTITNSVLSDAGWVFPAGTGIFVQSGVADVTIAHNEIYEFSYTAISLGWNWNYAPQPFTGGHLVVKNRIHHLGFPRRE